MTPREIIAEAWAITTREKSLRRWGFTASLFETLLDVKLLIYQTYFLFSYLQGDPIGFFKVEEILHEILPLWGFITFIIALLILFTIEIFLPKMCLGAIIGLAAKAHKKEELKGGLVLALYNFFPIFAIRELFVLGGTTAMITVISLILRYMGTGFRGLLITLTISFWALSNILRFFANFAEEETVIKKTGVFGSIGRSFKLIVSHLRHVVFLLILLFIISLRVLLNALVLLVLPGIIVGIGLLLATFLSVTLTIVISTIVGITLVFIASYFFAYLHVFQQTVWTITYMELSKLKDLDIIELEETPKEESVPQVDAAGPLPA
jgi:hypothetical protein